MSDHDCPICLEPLSPRFTECGNSHRVDTECLLTFAMISQTNLRCPLCQESLRLGEHNDSANPIPSPVSATTEVASDDYTDFDQSSSGYVPYTADHSEDYPLTEPFRTTPWFGSPGHRYPGAPLQRPPGRETLAPTTSNFPLRQSPALPPVAPRPRYYSPIFDGYVMTGAEGRQYLEQLRATNPGYPSMPTGISLLSLPIAQQAAIIARDPRLERVAQDVMYYGTLPGGSNQPEETWLTLRHGGGGGQNVKGSVDGMPGGGRRLGGKFGAGGLPPNFGGDAGPSSLVSRDDPRALDALWASVPPNLKRRITCGEWEVTYRRLFGRR
jgi:hypothetical protein